MADSTNKSDDHKMSRSEAGKLGGEETAKKGSEFYSEIGSQQGKENNPGNFANRPKSEVKDAAEKGGRASGETQDDQDLAA